MFWKKKLPLPPLAEGERDIWAELYVDLLVPIPDPEDPQAEQGLVAAVVQFQGAFPVARRLGGLSVS